MRNGILFLRLLAVCVPILTLAGSPAIAASTPTAAAKPTASVAPEPTKPLSKKAAEKLKQLVGTWKQVGGEDQLMFSADGKFEAKNSQVTMNGAYKMRDDGDVEIDLGLGPVGKGPVVRRPEFKKNEMTLRDVAADSSVTYKRAK